MKYLKYIAIIIVGLILTNCGSKNATSYNTDETNIKEKFSYFKAGRLVKDSNTTICYRGLGGDSYKIGISIYSDIISFNTESYRYENCAGEIQYFTYSAYTFELGDESEDTKSLDIKLENVSYNYEEKAFEIEKMVSKLIFNHIILTEPFYTKVVGEGDIRKSKIKIGFAQASAERDGLSLASKADDISAYINRTLYFFE